MLVLYQTQNLDVAFKYESCFLLLGKQSTILFKIQKYTLRQYEFQQDHFFGNFCWIVQNRDSWLFYWFLGMVFHWFFRKCTISTGIYNIASTSTNDISCFMDKISKYMDVLAFNAFYPIRSYHGNYLKSSIILYIQYIIHLIISTHVKEEKKEMHTCRVV